MSNYLGSYAFNDIPIYYSILYQYDICYQVIIFLMSSRYKTINQVISCSISSGFWIIMSCIKFDIKHISLNLLEVLIALWLNYRHKLSFYEV